MRLLLISGSYPPMKCGVGDYTYQLAQALTAVAAIDIGVLTSDDAEASSPTRVEVLADMPGWRVRDAWHALSALNRWKPDVVHIQYPTQGYDYGRLPMWLPMMAWLLGIKVVQTWHESTGVRGAASFLLRALVPGKVVVVRPGFRQGLHPLLRALLFSREPVFIANASSISRSRLDASQKQAAKQTYLAGQQRLIVFFGFVYPFKGVDLLFEIADASTDHIVIAGEVDRDSDYGRQLLQTAASTRWAGKVSFTGFLTSDAVADLLVVSDAVVLPFRQGGGEWNTSIHGAVLNGSYVITTSEHLRGFDPQQGIHYAPIDDVQEMKHALSLAAHRRPGSASGGSASADHDPWRGIAQAHVDLYQGVVGARAIGRN